MHDAKILSQNNTTSNTNAPLVRVIVQLVFLDLYITPLESFANIYSQNCYIISVTNAMDKVNCNYKKNTHIIEISH